MEIEVYCDESYPDIFSSNSQEARFLVIGSLWLEEKKRKRFKQDINELKNRYKIGGEFKWTKISASRIEFYKEVLNWFYSQGENLRFRCIAVDREKMDLFRFHQNDQELGFYKFYYQTLHHWIHSFNRYFIFCDYKRNRLANRLETLRNCLEKANIYASISNVQSIRSEESVLIQLSDVLTGMAAARLNKRFIRNSDNSINAKEEVTVFLEELLGREIAPTNLHEKKFNVFKINLQGGW